MLTEILVLANSIKKGNRCLAGIDIESGKWIRPVTGVNFREVANEATIKNGRWIRPGDLISIDLGQAIPLPYHPEDFEFTGEIKLLKINAVEEFAHLILNETQKKNQLLENNLDRIAFKTIESSPICNSLALTFANKIRFFANERGSKKVSFKIGSEDWSVSQTDDHLDSLQPIDEGLVCLSLAEPFPATQSHHKLAAGFINARKLDLIEASQQRSLSQNEFHSLTFIASQFTKRKLKIVPDERLKGKNWFHQTTIKIKCSECNSLIHEVFRAHEEIQNSKGSQILHRFALLCLSCGILNSTPLEDEKFRKNLREQVEKLRPVKQLCPDCIVH